MPATAHYFSPDPPRAGRTRTIVYRDGGREFTFRTAAGVFSRSAVDAGSRLLLAAIKLAGAERILDLGCGYGVLGIVAAARAPQAHVVLVDVNPRAVALAEENIARNATPNAEARCGEGARRWRAIASMSSYTIRPFAQAGRWCCGCCARPGRVWRREDDCTWWRGRIRVR